MSWALFVEGGWDEVFVRWLLEFLDVEDIQVHAIRGGVSKLRHAANEIQKSHDEGRRVALLLDADTDVERTRDELEREVGRLGLPIERSFLLPDNTGGGDLETLLVQMAPAAHQGVYDCFDQYETCLRTADRGYTTPNRKARVYAYCDAVGAKSGPDKNYADAAHWDPAVPGLEPLRRFLIDLNRVDETDVDATPEATGADAD
jgi:5S rRNA maturation endonuclease (ribonuclease M5)